MKNTAQVRLFESVAVRNSPLPWLALGSLRHLKLASYSHTHDRDGTAACAWAALFVKPLLMPSSHLPAAQKDERLKDYVDCAGTLACGYSSAAGGRKFVETLANRCSP